MSVHTTTKEITATQRHARGSLVQIGLVAAIERQVGARPSATAIVDGVERLTYATLNERANHIAQVLTEVVQPDVLVALFLDRSPDFAAAMLGVFKASAAYLPLEPNDPPGRIAQVLRESRAKVVIASQAQRERLDEALNISALQGSVRVVVLEDAYAATEPAGNPGRRAGLDDLAYVIFTSGSSGVPKGAMVEHRGMLNHLQAKLDELDLGVGCRIVQNASQCFDISVWQFLAPLVVGGELHILRGADIVDPARLFGYAERHGISILEIVPSLLKATIDWFGSVGALPNLERLRWLILTGEALPPRLCNGWFGYFPSIPMLNAYGPTECSDDVTHHVIRTRLPDDAVRVPIGKAIANVQLYVVRERETPIVLCEQGAIGELCVAGISVGRGYVNNRELTGQVFLRDPFQNNDARLYRTGDLVRQLVGGEYEYHGRVDRQVKLRGYRIELEEIEKALSQLDVVKDCAVLARRTERTNVYFLDNEQNQKPLGEGATDGRKVLVAYVVLRAPVSALQLRERLGESLPAFMLPEQFIEIESLPLTANGKLDVRALPDPRDERPDTGKPYVSPQHPLERQMCRLWEEVLGLDRVGLSDTFVELGGDSLQLVQLLNRIRKTFSTQLGFEDFLAAPDLASLCRKLADSAVEREGAIIPVSKQAKPGSRFPMSLGQQGLWFLWRLAPDVPYYTFQGILDVRGPLVPVAMQAAIGKLVERHAVLRTRFVHDSEPEQLICDPAEFACAFVDLSELALSERPERLRRLAREEAGRAFNLERETSFRASLYKLGEQDFAIVLTMHEIVMDAWATCVLIRELGLLYQAAKDGRLEQVGIPTVQFHDFASWERDQTNSASMQREAAYWKRQLTDSPPLLELPTDRPRPIAPSQRGDSVGVVLDLELSERIRSLGRGEQVTLFMTLLAAYYVLLRAYSGQDDIVVGAPNAGRDHPDTEDLLGYFINMLPMRMQLTGDPTFRELLRLTRETVAGALQHPRFPFKRMVEVRQAERDTRYSPVFQVMFDMLNFPKVPFSCEDLEVKFDELDVGYKKYDLELYAHEQGGRIYVRLSYLEDLFDRATADRILESYLSILRAVVLNADVKLSDIALCGPREQQRLLVEFNDTARPLPEGCIHQLFEQQVERTPQQVALWCGEERITFLELNQQANRLASSLRARGVQKGAPVGICLPRSIDEVAAILAVSKAGGCYVPLDPDYPDSRLADTLEEAQCQLFVANAVTSSRVAPNGFRRVLLEELVSTGSVDNLDTLQSQTDVLTVIGTSSSTGRPKATLITHRGVINRIAWMWRCWPWQEGDVTASLRSTALATHFWELYGSLLQGVPTIIVTREEVLRPSVLVGRLSRARVTALTASPSLLQLLLGEVEARPGQWKAPRYVASGGEPLPPKLAERFYGAFPSSKLINFYGTTETSATAATCDTSGRFSQAARIPAGWPIDNTQLYVLDDRRRPVPIGAVGEVYIGGEGVCAGYLNQPEVNAASFVPDPFSKVAGARLFRTRDRGVFHSDGSLEVLGRVDHMVKIRGFRVDLGEVTATLRLVPEITRCACTAFEDRDGQSIAAYYCSTSPLDSQVLRERLASALPHYMVPRCFVWLERMPLTSSGKVAYTELPAPVLEERAASTDSRPPCNEVEQKLVAIWEALLDVKPIGVRDNFFAIGGHSLAAAEMSRRIENELGVEVAIGLLYQGTATIERLAAHLAQPPAGE